MSDLGLYTKGTVYINGKLLAEETEISLKRTSNAQRVNTVAKGFAGLSPGAAIVEGTIQNAVPAVDFEYDPGDNIQGLTVVEITTFAAGNTLTVKAFIESDEFTHAVNSASALSFPFVGQMSTWD